MSSANNLVTGTPLRIRRLTTPSWLRLLRLEVRHSAMAWLVPLAAVLFWYNAYRPALAVPPLWSLRALGMQHAALLDFALPVTGAAAWMGSRESRRGTADLTGLAARPQWIRQLTSWAAVTSWALVAYVGCVGVLYAVTAHQAAWGGPLWWPAVVGAAGLPLLAALGYAAGSWLPGRFTPPLVSIAAFFALGFSAELAHGGRSYWQISPIIPGAVDVGANPGVATFYHYLPDLPIAQVMLLAGLAAVLLGLLGCPPGAGGRRVRATAALIATAGMATAVTAVVLVGTARLDPHGMMRIPALHNAASDRPIEYTPACGRGAIPVCLNPAFAMYLPVASSALAPVVKEVAGLPGAPNRILQAAPTFMQEPIDGISVGSDAGTASHAPNVLLASLPDQLPGERQPDITAAQFAAQIEAQVGAALVADVVGGYRQGDPAQQAVRAGVLMAAGVRLAPAGGRSDLLGTAALGPARGTPVYRAALRFAALPAAARHAWLAAHLRALRDGRMTLAQLP